MKKFLAILLVFCVILSIGGCSNDGPDNPKKEDHSPVSKNDPPVLNDDNDLVTVYLLVSETEYQKNGSIGCYQIKYTYDDCGNLLSGTTDNGLKEEIWNSDELIYEPVYHPFDGTIDGVAQYTYDYNGSIINWVNIYHDKTTDDYTDNRISYQYGKDGRIETVTFHFDEGTYQEYCCYDDNGNLCRVEGATENSDERKLTYQFNYDEKNRLTQAYYFTRWEAYFYEYSYNEADQLTSVGISLGEYSDNGEDITYKVQETKQFEYDKYGDFLSATYHNPFTNEIDTVTADDVSAYSTKYLSYDKNGNIIRRNGGNYVEDGYIEYEYKAIQVTKEQADRIQRVQYLRNGMTEATVASKIIRYIPGKEYLSQVLFPISPMYQINLYREF